MEAPRVSAKELYQILFPDTFEEEMELYMHLIDAAFFILYEVKITQSPRYERDANLLYQMTVLKCRSVLKLSEGFSSYINPIDKTLWNPLFDSFSIFSIVRPQFEAFCNFNNIYLQSKNQDELSLKYHLWVLSGLNYRQGFGVISEENKQKKKDEKMQIDEIKLAIEQNSCYRQLDQKAKDNITTAIDRKEWKLEINGNTARAVHWHNLMRNSGIKVVYEHLYAHLSLGTHPSNVSVFQFGSDGGRQEQCISPIQISGIFIAFLIRDYCKFFNTGKSSFQKLPLHYKLIINSYNGLIRGKEYLIAD